MWNYSTYTNNFVNNENTASFSYPHNDTSGQEDFNLIESNDSLYAIPKCDWLLTSNTSVSDGFATSDSDFLPLGNTNLEANWAQCFNLPSNSSSILELQSPAFTSPTLSDSHRSGYFDFPKDILQENSLLDSTDEDEKIPQTRPAVPTISSGLETAWGKGRGGSKRYESPIAEKPFKAETSSQGSSSSSPTPRASGEITRRPNLISEKTQDHNEPKRGRRRKPSGDKYVNKRRDTHNAIERQYRDRLNNHFTELLSILPDNVVQASVGSDAATIETKGDSGRYFTTKKVCKGAVLDLAMKHILKLETENEELSFRNSCFEKKLKALGGDSMGWVP